MAFLPRGRAGQLRAALQAVGAGELLGSSSDPDTVCNGMWQAVIGRFLPGFYGYATPGLAL
ncbi:MAG: hypothetical protein HRT77_01935 [Halioglobus sp.]|nr:hypothetical protein [Halioglobus sp.]